MLKRIKDTFFKKTCSKVYKLQYLPGQGGIIEYCRFGRGNPLFMVMGYAATLNGWDYRLLDELAKTHEIIVFNNRGTGRSISTVAKYSLYDLANDVERLREGLGLGKIALAGISMGGIIAQCYASIYPDKLTHLILINTLPPGQLIDRPKIEIENILRGVKPSKKLSYWPLLKLLLPSIWQFYYVYRFHFKPKGSKYKVSDEAIVAQQKILEEWSQLSNPEVILSKIINPVLILLGNSDRLVPPNNSYTLKKLLKVSHLVEFKEGGHVMIFQYPIEIAKIIQGYIC